MKRRIYIAGEKTNMWTFIKEIDPFIRKCGKPRRMGLFKCDCGEEKEVLLETVFNNTSKSCGCYHTQVMKEGAFAKTHGLSSHPLFTVWKRMIDRCYDERHHAFKHYGGRGIIMCDEWKNSPTEFVNWALANGWQKGLQTDRTNNNGIYEPTNCRFVTREVNMANRRPYKKRDPKQ